MKPYVLPVATALMGFTIAWVAKPASTSPATSTPTTQNAPGRSSPRDVENLRDNAGTAKSPAEVKAADFPLVADAEAGPKSAEEAKMMRLAEALSLSVDQQGSIVQLVSDIQANANMEVSAIEDISTRGKAIEDGLQKILSPEQFARFQEIQVRERENRTEMRAQRQLADTIEFIDLSTEQREEVLNRLRQKSKADLQAIPAAATLLFDKSILPNGGKELSVDGILLLAQADGDLSIGDPQVVHEKVMNQHKAQLEEQLRCFDGILTPGQMGQYHAALAEKEATMQRMRETIANLPKKVEYDGDSPVAEPDPVDIPPVEEIVTDDDTQDDYEE